MPAAEELTLPNGIRILSFADRHFDTAAVSVVIGAGSRHDPVGQGGSLHLLEHLLMSSDVTASTDGRPRPLAEEIEFAGGRGNAVTGLELTLLHAQVLPSLAAPTLASFVSVLLALGVGEKQFESERGAVLQELAAAAADPYDVVQDAYLGALFPGHPLGRPVGGTTAEVRAATVRQLRHLHRDLLARAPIALVSVGPLGTAEVLDAVRGSGLEDLPARTPAAAADGPPVPPPAPSEPFPDWPGEFCWVSVGGRSPAAGDPARHAYTVLGHLLGGSPASLLYRRLRHEKSLGYNFQAWNRSYLDAGSWRVVVGAEPENGPLVVETVRSCLAEVAAAPDPRLLAAARRQAAFELLEEADSPLGRVIQVARGTYAGTRAWSAEEDAAALQTVAPDEVRAAADAILRELTVVVRPVAER